MNNKLTEADKVKMRRGAPLTEEKKRHNCGTINGSSKHSSSCKSHRKKQKCSSRLSQVAGQSRKSPGVPRKMTSALTRRLLRAASDEVKSSNALLKSIELPIFHQLCAVHWIAVGSLRTKKVHVSLLATKQNNNRALLNHKNVPWSTID